MKNIPEIVPIYPIIWGKSGEWLLIKQPNIQTEISEFYFLGIQNNSANSAQFRTIPRNGIPI